MRLVLIIFSFVAFLSSGHAQTKGSDQPHDQLPMDDEKASPSNLAVAKFQIFDIKQRGVIVRLKTDKDRIQAYRKAGYKAMADKLEDVALWRNRMLIHAFVTKWTYCPVYFMESQHSRALMNDSLIAKTYDLLSDTLILVNHDSIYLVDFGDLMRNEPAGTNTDFIVIDKKMKNGIGVKKATTEESNTPISYNYLVVKDHDQKQLQPPMPFFSGVVFASITSQTLKQFDMPGLIDILKLKLKSSQDPWLLFKDQDGGYVKSLNDKLWTHINAKMSNYQKSVERLNERFISYYCKRLDKDRNILGNEDPYFWWQRNPNLPYLLFLPDIEQWFVPAAEKEKTFIKPR